MPRVALLFLQLACCFGIIAKEIPFRLQDDLIWIEVSADGANEKLRFLLDTGASVSVLNAETCRKLKLRRGPKVNVAGVSSEVTGFYPSHLRARAGEVKLPSKFLVLDLSELSRSFGGRVDGLIGLDFFRNQIVQIDYQARSVRILKRLDTVSCESVPLQVRQCGMRVPVSVSGNDAQWMRVDTGCASPLQWVTTKIPESSGRKMAVGLAEVSIPQSEITVRVGTVQFEEVPTGLHRAPLFPGEAGLLGNGLLSRFTRVTIDCRAGRLILEQ